MWRSVRCYHLAILLLLLLLMRRRGLDQRQQRFICLHSLTADSPRCPCLPGREQRGRKTAHTDGFYAAVVKSNVVKKENLKLRTATVFSRDVAEGKQSSVTHYFFQQWRSVSAIAIFRHMQVKWTQSHRSVCPSVRVKIKLLLGIFQSFHF